MSTTVAAMRNNNASRVSNSICAWFCTFKLPVARGSPPAGFEATRFKPLNCNPVLQLRVVLCRAAALHLAFADQLILFARQRP